LALALEGVHGDSFRRVGREVVRFVSGAAILAKHLRRHLKKGADMRTGRLGMAGVGRVYVWGDGSLFIGHGGGRAQPHAHHALQITVAVSPDEQAFVLHAAGTAARISRFCLVPAHLRHVFDGGGGHIAHVFVAPESREGRALTARYGKESVVALEDDAGKAAAERWRRCFFTTRRDEDDTVRTARSLVAELARTAPATAPSDSRISALREHVARHPGGKLSLEEAARVVHLSPGRLRHLFVEETGTTFRSYLVWQRLLNATATVMEGGNWTDAAHASGFADSAHLSRSFRQMFGVSPTMIARDEG